MTVEQRIEIEKKVLRHLIRSMKGNGWVVVRIDDGGEEDEDTIDPNETEAMDAVFAVDECVIYFRKQVSATVGKTHYAQIVLGNDGWDCIADHSYAADGSDNFNTIMDEVQDYADKLQG